MTKQEFIIIALASKPSAICLFETIERTTLTNKIFKIDCVDLDDTWKYWTSDKNFVRQINLKSKGFKGNEFKLILRPLSDLTKEIIINHVCFVPCEQFTFEVESDLRKCIVDEELPFAVIKQLIKWNFDIFGLIEKGEAVDYHTLPDFVF